MRINNQIFIEWAIKRDYEDFSFTKSIESALNLVSLKEGEKVEVHQVKCRGS